MSQQKIVLVKCRQCRHLIAERPISAFLTAHSTPVVDIYGCFLNCAGNPEDVWYLEEESMPDWTRNAVEEGNWLKDKLKCPHCSANLGNFDFVSGHKCPCRHCNVPFIHFVKSKIDVQYKGTS